MKRLSQIDEGVFSDILKRDNENIPRFEDGKKVTTCLGIDVILKDYGYDYNNLIKSILEGDEAFTRPVCRMSDGKYSPEEIKKIRNLEDPYTYILYNGTPRTSLVAAFEDYDYVLDWYLNDFICKDDYLALCKCIAMKLMEVGEHLELAPHRYISLWSYQCVIQDYISSKKAVYAGEYHLLLISEEQTYRYEADNPDDEDYLERYMTDMINEFPELKDQDFIYWTYREGNNIALPLNVDNIANFKKYQDYTLDWFA